MKNLKLLKLKKNLLLVAAIFFIGFIQSLIGFTHAQTLDFTLTVPANPFQDADVGAMAFADIDNDGDQDLIITGKGGPIKTTLYKNDGTGNFTAATGTAFVNVFDGSVGFADVNNDGFIDLLITGSTSAPSRTANLYINNGNGTFSIATTPITPSSAGDFAFADIDNDGDLDLIVTGLNANDVGFTTLYRNLGNANFAAVAPSPFEQVGLSSVAFIDVDNDGDRDVILAGENSSATKSTKLYLNNGNGVFTLDVTNSFTGIALGDIATADANNNGYMDILITGSSADGSITKLYSNNGNGTFSEISGTPFPGTSVGAVEFADFDNDGYQDVLLLGAGNFNGLSALAHIYKNEGNNTFTLAAEFIPTYLASAAIADIDGDNDLDFIIGGTHFSQPIRNPKLYTNNLNTPSTVYENTDAVLISYYPNPTKDVVFINTKSNMDKITVLNAFGQTVMTKKVNSENFEVNLSHFNTGFYFVKIENDRSHKTIKLYKN